MDNERLGCPPAHCSYLPQNTGINTCIFQLQKLNLDIESLADNWQRWDLNPSLSGSRAMSHPASHTSYWNSC